MATSRFMLLVMVNRSPSTEGFKGDFKLDDQDGLISLPTPEIFAQLALMGYVTDSNKLTFQKGAFSPQWRGCSFVLSNRGVYPTMPRHAEATKLQQPIQEIILVPSLTISVSNMKRSTKGFSRQEVPLFSTMIDAAESSHSPSRSTSSPSTTPTSSPT
ncbi:hypothetical protein Tco_0318181 [Tanacetum coccineum]